LQDELPHQALQGQPVAALHAACLLSWVWKADEGGVMSKLSHAAIIAFLAVCTALMATLLLAQDVDEGYAYEADEYEDEEDEWS